jgi:hypothetical protein
MNFSNECFQGHYIKVQCRSHQEAMSKQASCRVFMAIYIADPNNQFQGEEFGGNQD